jgi:hypothetical protein
MKGNPMSRRWTDEDVARMLGWKEWNVGTGIWGPTNCIYLQHTPNFGLSTPPSPDADANAARYVLPWLRENHLDFGYAWFKMLFLEDVTVTLVQYGEDAQDESKDVLLEVYDDHFCKAICIAALEAYHAGRKDNGE